MGRAKRTGGDPAFAKRKVGDLRKEASSIRNKKCGPGVSKYSTSKKCGPGVSKLNKAGLVRYIKSNK
jgi:hypothetical protein